MSSGVRGISCGPKMLMSEGKRPVARMMADRWYSPNQNGSQEQHLCPQGLEGYRVVRRCYCHKERDLSPE